MVGKLADDVWPARSGFPSASTARLKPRSSPDPPTYVDETSDAPFALSFAMNASLPPARFAWNGFAVGKLVELVSPAIHTSPFESAMSYAQSPLPPPRCVE